MRVRGLAVAALAAASVLAVVAQAVLHAGAGGADDELTMYRFFGGCADEYAGVTELPAAAGECAVIQVLTNRFNAETRSGFHVVTQTVEWSAYYDRLSAAYAAGHPPDVAILHRSSLPDFVSRGLVQPVGAELARLGVAADDILPSALSDVTFGGEMRALPFDLHALLWHVNLDLLAQAGLVAADGAPMLPRSPEELAEHARRVRERTGKRYVAIPSQTDPMPTWLFESWIWQQGGDLIAPDLKHATLEDPAARRSLGLLAGLYAQGVADPGQDYSGAESAFLDGEAAVLVNGTWVVDHYLAESRRADTRLRRYGAFTPPTLFAQPAAWSDGHVWVLPENPAANSRKRAAALEFLRFLYAHDGDWARTGHLPVRRSVLASESFRALPERRHYAATAEIARGLPPVPYQRTLQDVLVQEVNATWQAPQPPEISLGNAQRMADETLRRTPGGGQ